MPQHTKQEDTKQKVAAVFAMGTFYRVPKGGAVGCIYVTAGKALDVPSPEYTAAVAQVCGLAPWSRLTKKVADAAAAVAYTVAPTTQIEMLSAGTHGGPFAVNLGGGNLTVCKDGQWWCVPNGSHGVVFKEERFFEPLDVQAVQASIAKPDAHRFPKLREVFLDRMPPPKGLLTRTEQAALMLGLWIGIFIGCLTKNRPIYLLKGEQEIGKTVVQRVLAKLFFGRKGEVTGGTSAARTMKDVAAAATDLSVIIRDDLNDLPTDSFDALCRIATGTRFDVAGFFQTLGLESFDPRGMVFLSAIWLPWLPKRPDLMSRIVLLELGAPPKSERTPEDWYEEVLAVRPEVWGETLAALAALNDAPPIRERITRFDAWERAVCAVLERAGLRQDFESALAKMRGEVMRIALEQSPLMEALLRFAYERGQKPATVAEIADGVGSVLGALQGGAESHNARLVVGSPQSLAQFLTRIRDEGSPFVDVRSAGGHDHKARWTLVPKVPLPGASTVQAPPSVPVEPTR